MKKKAVAHRYPKPVYTRKEVFTGPRIIAASYTASAVKPDQYPEGDTIEIAFLGRSNVGKSSLINSLCNHRGLALVKLKPSISLPLNLKKTGQMIWNVVLIGSWWIDQVMAMRRQGDRIQIFGPLS